MVHQQEMKEIRPHPLSQTEIQCSEKDALELRMRSKGHKWNSGMIRVTNWSQDIGNTVTRVRTRKEIKQVSSIRDMVRNVSGRGNNLGDILRD